MIRYSVFFLAICAAVVVRGQETRSQFDLLDVSGEFQSLDQQTGEHQLKGNVVLNAEGVRLTADEMRYNSKTHVATATGHVTFTSVGAALAPVGLPRGEFRLLADRLVFDRKDSSFQADNIRFGSHPYFIEGFSASGTPREIAIKRAKVSYGEPGPWQPTWLADTITVVPGERIRSENSQLGIGHFQPVPIPRFQQNFAQPFVGDVSLSAGFRRSLGAFIEAGTRLPLRPSFRPGADLGVYTNRGIMFGPATEYARPESPLLRGFFRSGYINDHGDKKTDILGRAVPEERGFAEWQHQQLIAEHLTLTAQANWWSDSEVLRDFRPRAFFPVQEPDTFLESIYAGPNYFVSAFARFQPNRFHRVQERLPEVRFDLLPSAMGGGFYHRFNASAAALREDPLFGGTSLRSDRLDAYYAVSRPIAHRDWLAVTPMIGGRLTRYSNMEGIVRTGNYTRLLGEVGVDAVLRTTGTFAYQNEQWNIDGLRHLFTPRVSYRYVPEKDRGIARIPRIDREVFSTYLQPLGLANPRSIDDLRATNTLRLSFDNVLQTRDRTEGTRDLLVFNVANDFRFRRQPGERDVSEIHTELALMPTRWLQVDVYQSFRPQDFVLRELNSAVTIRDGNVWSLRFANNFLRHEIQDYQVDGRVRLNERFDALTRLHYDARKRRFNEQSYGIVQNLGNTWLISYTVSLYSGRRRESSFGFNVRIDAVRF